MQKKLYLSLLFAALVVGLLFLIVINEEPVSSEAKEPVIEEVDNIKIQHPLWGEVNGKDALMVADDHYLIYFHRDSCSYCQEFKPELVTYLDKDNALPIYQINLDNPDEESTWDYFKIEGTPTIIEVEKDFKEQKIYLRNKFEGIVGIEQLPTKKHYDRNS